MKRKIYIVLENLEMKFLGYSDSLKDWFFHAEGGRVIVPFNGKDDYTVVHNVYNKQYKQRVTYQAITP